MKRDRPAHADPAPLFRLSRDAVLGVRNGTVAFSNPAAAGLFGTDVTGRPLAALFPELPAEGGDEAFSAAVTVKGRACLLTGVRWEELLVLTLRFQEPAAPLPPAAMSRLRTAAANLRLSIDRLVGPEDRSPDAAALFHSYYSLLHVAERLSDLNDLAGEGLPFAPRPLELGQLAGDLTDSVAVFTRERGVAVSCRLPEEPVLVMGDRGRLEQLLLILLANSLHSTPAGGEIVLTLRRADRQVILTVADSGRGLSDRDLAGAFAPRNDTDPALLPAASGLGLYVAQGIARLHGGALVLQSKEGEGTRASVSLPAAGSLTLRDADEPAPTGPRRILTELSDVLSPAAYGQQYMD